MRTESFAPARPSAAPMMFQSLRDLPVKLVFRLVAHALFRVRVLGREHAPSHGPALLVSNHLTYLDAFLIGSCSSPVIRFLVWKPYYDCNRVISWSLRLAKAIPIWTTPDSAVQAVRRARRELERGEVVCIFAEGSISRTGELLPFKRGLEAIARDLNSPIVPVHLDGLWGSMFSFKSGRFFWKWPRRLRHPVIISFGPSLPPSSTAQEVRQAVEILSANAGAVGATR